MNRLKFIKNVLYRFKRSYGLPIDYYQLASHSINLESGDKGTTLTVVHIKKAIVLRAREFRSFVYDLAYISANKDFTTGGFFDPEDRRVIVDARDVDTNFEPNIDDYFIFQNEKYTVKEVLHFENNSAYGFLARKVRGALLVRMENSLSVINLQQDVEYIIQDQLDRSVTSTLTLTQDIEELP